MEFFSGKCEKEMVTEQNILVGSVVVKAISLMCKAAFNNSSGNTTECQIKKSYTSGLLVVTEEGISDRKCEC